MSRVAIKGADTGTGVFTLESPATNTDRTLVLPDEAGTVLTSVSSLPAGSLTGSVPASAMPAGSVIQVVMGITSTYAITSSTSYVDAGLSATITPSSASSKILALVNVPDTHNNGSASLLYLNLVRGSTQIIEFVKHGDHIATGTSIVTYGGSTSYLDSPNTTSATTYKVQFKVGNGGLQSLFLNYGTGTIVLMEIAG
jgi:hypothetical protein